MEYDITENNEGNLKSNELAIQKSANGSVPSYMCVFITTLVSQEYQLVDPSEEFFIPGDITRVELSHLINSQLGLLGTELEKPFDFYIHEKEGSQGTFLCTTLQEHFTTKKIDGETTTTIEYTLSLPPPEIESSCRVDDWVSKICPNVGSFLSFKGKEAYSSISAAGCYDGSINFFGHSADESLLVKDASGAIIDKKIASVRIFSSPIKAMCVHTDGDGNRFIACGGNEGRVLSIPLNYNAAGKEGAIDDNETIEDTLDSVLKKPTFEFRPMHDQQQIQDVLNPVIDWKEISGKTMILEAPITALAGTENRLLGVGTQGSGICVYMLNASGKKEVQKKIQEQEIMADKSVTGKRIHGAKIIKSKNSDLVDANAQAVEKKNSVGTVFFNPNGHMSYTISSMQFIKGDTVIATAGYDNKIKCWDMAKDRLITNISGPAPCEVISAQKINDNLILGGFHDRTVRLFDIRKPKPLVSTFVGHKHSISDISLHQGGVNVVSSCLGGEIKLWDIRSPVALWNIDCYEKLLDKKRDQARTLAVQWDSSDPLKQRFVSGGSNRKVVTHIMKTEN